MRILIADDEGTSRLILARVLKKMGHEPIEAENGRDSLKILKGSNPPPLAVIDWVMPDLDGIEVVRKLRKSRLSMQPYIMMLTARSSKEDLIAGLDSGADDYIIKPIDIAEFRARVNVGIRIIELQQRMVEQKKLEGVLEMAGAVLHEMNQPLQIVMGFAELLTLKLDENDPNNDLVKSILSGIRRIGELTQQIAAITTYEPKSYLSGKIVDIKQSSLKTTSRKQEKKD